MSSFFSGTPTPEAPSSMLPVPPAYLAAGVGLVVLLLVVVGAALKKKKSKKAAKKAPAATTLATSRPRRASKSPARLGGTETPTSMRKRRTYLADKNGDGTTTRAEAAAVNLTVSADDINDDGRVTRSEKKAASGSAYRKRLA